MIKINRFIKISALILAVGFIMTTAPAAAQDEIAFVNLQEVFEAHPDKGEAEEQLNLEAQEMQSELEEEADELGEEEQQQLLQEYQEELSQREQELIQEVLADIEDLLNQLAEEKGVSVVLDGQNVLYGGYDLTPELIEMIE
ncbi:MAG: OmpH family outer membrane protein [Bacillota bacterium]